MRTKRFEFNKKDVNHLKKDIILRTLFSILFLTVFVWQMISIVKKSTGNNLSIIQTTVSIIVLIGSLLLGLVSLFYAFKDFRIISVIKVNGRCINSVPILFSTKKSGFVWLYNILIQILTLATTLVLIACITYTILEISYFATISFYVPILVFVCISGYNAIYHIREEIYKQNILNEQKPLY